MISEEKLDSYESELKYYNWRDLKIRNMIMKESCPYKRRDLEAKLGLVDNEVRRIKSVLERNGRDLPLYH